jgi:hypothetical protein
MRTSKATRIGGVLTLSVGKNCGNWFAIGCGICGWLWDKRCRKARQREIEWAPPKEATLVFLETDPHPEEYGPWRKAAERGRATGRFGAAAFEVQENGTLRCPAGASLWLSEVRQETPFTRAAGLPRLSDGLPALLLSGALPGTRSQKSSCSPRECRPPSLARPFGGDTHACRSRLNAVGRCRRSSAAPHLDGPLA